MTGRASEASVPQRAPDPCGRKTRGFTLIELVLVLFIISLAAGLALPAVGRGVDALQLRAEVAAFSAFLRHAREQAITRRQAQEARIDPASHRLTLTPAGAADASVSRRLSPRIDVRAEGGTALTLTFTPRGLSAGGSFRLAGPGGRAYRVRVHPLTGRVTSTRVS